MSAMAIGMASKVASVAMSTAEKEMKKKMEDGKGTMPCIGKHCCKKSTCMNIPGLRCSRDRGPTQCVGSSAFPPIQGMCACLAGACSPEGTCSSDGLSQTFEDQEPVPADPVAADLSTWQQQGSSTKQSETPSAKTESPFNAWHRTANLYSSHPPLDTESSRQSSPMVIASSLMVMGCVLAVSAFTVIRVGATYRQRRREQRNRIRLPANDVLNNWADDAGVPGVVE